jgi:DNA-binding beta-propeller fold protein YncE
VVLEAGERQYQVVKGWGQLPEGWIWGQVGAVAVDSQDNVHVFTRTRHPYMVFDKSGKLVDEWGYGIFEDAHGLYIAPNDDIYFVDRDPQIVLKFNKSGRHQFTLGNKHEPADTGYTNENRVVTHAGPPFHHPTDLSVSPSGEFYVSDGYRNCRVHKYAADGTLIKSWGEPGQGDGQFVLVHSVWEHNGRVYVADRQNNRLQVFDTEGKHLETWPGFLQPTKIFVDKDEVMYVAELGSRVTICDLQGNVLARWGGEASDEPGEFRAPHGIWTDSDGSIYVSEVLQGARLQKFERVK